MGEVIIFRSGCDSLSTRPSLTLEREGSVRESVKEAV